MARFSDEEIRRYSRQMLLGEVGGRGQERLRASAVLLHAPDLIGEVAAEYLARAGVPVHSLLPANPRFHRAFPRVSQALLAEEEPGLWAASQGALAEIGQGCPCRGGLQAGEAAAQAAFLAGSLFSLHTIKRLLGLPVEPAHLSPSVLRIDLSAPEGGAAGLLTWRPALPCRCGAGAGPRAKAS